MKNHVSGSYGRRVGPFGIAQGAACFCGENMSRGSYSAGLAAADWHSNRNELRLFCLFRRRLIAGIDVFDPVLHRFPSPKHLPGGESVAQVLFVLKVNDFETRYKRHLPRVIKFFLNKNVPMEEAEELAQDTFLRIFQHGEDFRQETKFGNWACIVADNVWKNYIRDKKTNKRKGTVVGLDGIKLVDEPNQTEPEEDEQLSKLRRAIFGLPTRMRHVVALRIYRELRFSQIAKILKRSEDTVKSQMSHAKKKLGDVLGENTIEEADKV